MISPLGEVVMESGGTAAPDNAPDKLFPSPLGEVVMERVHFWKPY
ncbi:hypothetical protein [Nostoc sp.]